MPSSAPFSARASDAGRAPPITLTGKCFSFSCAAAAPRWTTTGAAFHASCAGARASAAGQPGQELVAPQDDAGAATVARDDARERAQGRFGDHALRRRPVVFVGVEGVDQPARRG